METTQESFTGEAVDMTGKVSAERAEKSTDHIFEKEQREAEKKNAKKAPKGEYIVAVPTLKIDGKILKRGDVYEGKLYQSLLDRNHLMTTKEWESR